MDNARVRTELQTIFNPKPILPFRVYLHDRSQFTPVRPDTLTLPEEFQIQVQAKLTEDALNRSLRRI